MVHFKWGINSTFQMGIGISYKKMEELTSIKKSLVSLLHNYLFDLFMSNFETRSLITKSKLGHGGEPLIKSEKTNTSYVRKNTDGFYAHNF
jgi:hypothetical protein